MWFAIWAVLVLGTLVGAFLLARRLWRSVKGVGRELQRASQVLGTASERIARLSDELAAAQPSTSPTLFDDPVDLRRRVDVVRAGRAERRAERRVRHERVWDRWRTFNA